MSRETVEVVRRAYEAFNRGDLEAMSADAAPEFEYVATGVIPGAGGVYRGREEYVRFLEQWWGEFDEPTVDVHELVDADERVLASVTFRGGGKQSRVETTWSLWQLWTVQNGKVVRGQGFTGRDDAPRGGQDARVGRDRLRRHLHGSNTCRTGLRHRLEHGVAGGRSISDQLRGSPVSKRSCVPPVPHPSTSEREASAPPG